MGNEKYIVYACFPSIVSTDVDNFLVRDDFPGKQKNKRFFPDFKEAKEYDTYDAALMDVSRGCELSVKDVMNKYIFIDIHPRYRYE